MLKRIALALIVATTAASAYTVSATPAEAQGWRNQNNEVRRGARRDVRGARRDVRGARRDVRGARRDVRGARRDWRATRHVGPGNRYRANRYQANRYRVNRYPVNSYYTRNYRPAPRYNYGRPYYAPRRPVVVHRHHYRRHGPGPLGWLIRGLVRDLTR